ncbi:MAG TPA: PorP/SprF family type IX secretion system membrane protein [Taishania sp.]|nr:PorP/SprF family type IX secretion system membrane protein [Taishania sp.]
MLRIFFISIILSSTSVFGQTNTRFSQINVAKALLNPGALGVDAKVSTELIYRNQWTAQPGTPSTFGFVGGYELNEDHAIGLSFINDQVGIAKSNFINLGYAYRVHFNDEQFLALGATVGVQNINNDYASLFLIRQNDPAFAQSFNQWRFVAGFGAYYDGPNMYLGYSIPSLFNNIHTGPNNGFRINMWHHYVTTGFYIKNRTRSYIFNPCIQVKFVPNAPIQGDLLLRNIFNGRTAISVGYRTENAIVAGFDILISNVARIGYSFNYNLGRFSSFMATSHELYLAMGLPYYYNDNKFSQRKYIDKKQNFSRIYRKRAKRFNSR